MPLLRTAMYAKGIGLYCAPTVDDRDSWLPSMQMITLAQIDTREIARGKYDLDVVGRYARPDIFHLHVNEASLRPVIASGP